ncbi:MAG: SMP-30/gluconolactonase/LRE family protein [Deltaproteobacteria bacterium]|nr:SMP-30/gluconolactonase/LRE family protein [Deltaproteobacteria bacterium]MBW2445957.1 SMP-30/gluconolactonase/LRE family protein [Deltaproteobacteria bacterium]
MSSAPEQLELLESGYGLIEGPRVDAEDRLYFSDVIRGGVFRRTPEGEVETIVPKRRGVGGIALHEAGGVVVSGRNVCHVRDGQTRILFDPADTPSFNDLFTDSQGRILVGSMRYDPFSREGPRDPGELYRVEADGEATRLYDDIAMANGIGLSADGRLLFQNDSARNEILVHDVAEDGRCLNRRVFARAQRGTPDGLAVDEQGGVWVAEHGGGCVTRYASDGALDQHVEIPARLVISLCLGGPDRRDLYVTTADHREDPDLGGCIFRTRADVPGVPVALARV